MQYRRAERSIFKLLFLINKFLSKAKKQKNFQPIFHLWIKPNFSEATHWIFYNPAQQLNPQPDPKILKISWDRKNDMGRFTSADLSELEPNFIIDIRDITWISFKSILEKLRSIEIPLFQSGEFFGRDGDTFGAETFGIQNTKIVWHKEISDEWKKLHEVFLETENILRNLF